MTTNIANAIAAYANTGKLSDSPLAPSSGTGQGTSAGSGTSFEALLKTGLENAVETLQQSESAGVKASLGKADITDLVMAVNNAEVALQTVTAVRDRAVQAYQDILRMPI